MFVGVASRCDAARKAGCQFRLFPGYPATVNDREMAEFVAGVAAEMVGRANVVRDLVMMGSEDMSEFLNRVPGCFFFVGSGKVERTLNYPHHHPNFDFDEEAMVLAAALMASSAAHYLLPGPT